MKSVNAAFPFQIVSLDTGCITYGNEQKIYFLVAVDHYTQWIEVQMLLEETWKK